jgi:hypothetical protein
MPRHTLGPFRPTAYAEASIRQGFRDRTPVAQHCDVLVDSKVAIPSSTVLFMALKNSAFSRAKRLPFVACKNSGRCSSRIEPVVGRCL